MAYRDNIRVIYEVLTAIKNQANCNISQIARIANIAHYSLDDRLAILKKSDIVVESTGMSNDSRGSRPMRIFTLTHKGQQFQTRLSILFDDLQQMGIATN